MHSFMYVLLPVSCPAGKISLV